MHRVSLRFKAARARHATSQIRIAWLAGAFFVRRRVTFADYVERFGGGYRTVHRDIAYLRDAGFILRGHHSSEGGGWSFVCFRSEPEAA